MARIPAVLGCFGSTAQRASNALRALLLQVYTQMDRRPFRPHVTPARIRVMDGELPERAQSIHSALKPSNCSKTGYRIVASAALGESVRDVAAGPFSI